MKLWARGERLICSPTGYRAMLETNALIDVRKILPQVRVPTLVLHCEPDKAVPVANGRYIARRIPGAQYVEYPSGDHRPWGEENVEKLSGDIEEFVTGHRDASLNVEFERLLTTVLFTDIVDSTRRMANVGDKRWRDVLDQHDRLAQRLIPQYRGRLIKNTGDGILASFDGPGRCIKCALSLLAAAKSVGLEVRAGLHTGEVETRGDDIAGIAVNAAARIMGAAEPSEILVSRVVTDLVAGSGVAFTPKGARELKGLPGPWELFAATSLPVT